jgi:hypothetical protein
LKYITYNAKEFQKDIQNMTGKSVPEYVKYMTLGDDIMIIAMCLDFNASITMTRPTTIVLLGASCSSGGVSASDHTVPQSIYSGK